MYAITTRQLFGNHYVTYILCCFVSLKIALHHRDNNTVVSSQNKPNMYINKNHAHIPQAQNIIIIFAISYIVAM